MSLDKVAALLDDPDVDPVDHLRRQYELLTERPEELFEVFGEFDPGEHADEVEERWGDTDAYRESQRRVTTYGKADWQRIKAEAEDHGRRLVAAFEAGHAPDSPEGMDLAEEHRQHIGR